MSAPAAQPVAPGAPDGHPLVEVDNLVKHFAIGGGILRKPAGAVRAVDGVNLTISRGETVGLVGESGSGKSTLGRLVLRLIEPTSGTVRFDGRDIGALGPRELKPLRRRMQLIFQDPVSSMNPRSSIENILTEPMRVHGIGDPKTYRDRCVELLEQVGLTSAVLERYPHQFSGGQAQRIGIARALTTEPDLLVCDEAVSALDVSVQAQVLNLLRRLQKELGLTYLFIAHDLNVVRYISDRVCVMYLGQLVETGPSDDLMGDPQHPYTQALVKAIPAVGKGHPPRQPLTGEIPSPSRPPAGCRFHTRCPKVFSGCEVDAPRLREIAPGRHASCRLFEEDGAGG